MTFKYWEYRSEIEKELPVQSENEIKKELSEQSETEKAVTDAIASVSEKIAESINEEIPVQADETTVVKPKKSTARKIFVDGLLGVPFLIVMLVIISALVAAMTTVTIALGAGTLACLCASLLSIAYSFIAFGSVISTGLILLSAGLIFGAICCLTLILTCLAGGKAVPFIGGWYIKIVKKLNLFK